MKICIVAEGSYPYIVGGVSSWIDMLMKLMPQHEFIIQTIAASREDKGKFKYELPPNLTSVSEAFLVDKDYLSKGHKKLHLSKGEKDALRSFVYGEDVDWAGFFDLFLENEISVNELVMGADFLEIISDFCDNKYDRVVYSNFLWTYRSMMAPLCVLLKNRPPEADLYHTVSTGYAGIMASMASHLYNKPVLLSEHGIYTRERMEDIIRSDWTKGVYKDIWIQHFYKLSDCAYKYSSKVTSLFEGARQLQVEIGCPLEKTLVLPNGVDVPSFENLEQKEEGDKSINIGAVARVTPIKDIKTMINAFSYAKEQVPEIKLYIMGPTDEDEDYYNECLSLVEMLGVKDIVFTGRVNVREYVGKMDISILTSISEGQPLSVLEFMSASKPCIATRVGCCEELLYGLEEGDKPCGIITSVLNVTQIAEAIVTLARDEDMRKTMGKIGHDRAREKYSDKLFNERIENLYSDIYAEGRR